MTKVTILLFLAAFAFAAGQGHAQTMPTTPGVTLSGRALVLSQAVQGHATVIVAGFSRESSDGCNAWAKAARSDQALAGVEVYQLANLQQAPGFVRGMILSAMRKGLSATEQDHFVILKQDQEQWKGYFQVDGDKAAYAILLSAAGQILWHGHGAAKDLEPLLRAARR